ncbi:conserved hypothetical protein [Stutzerimonas stutzeri A1501]|uniref:Uncharacterized protein n=1 Tax=Stutzerimonas stutzeri (strain A1501) TaxID=379731 RepID=A4VLL4_STUS1|nr:conserved hypothetical protein [Stutzerimonas stutzeri A1501]
MLCLFGRMLALSNIQIKLPLVVLDQTPCRQHNGWTIDKRGKATTIAPLNA